MSQQAYTSRRGVLFFLSLPPVLVACIFGPACALAYLLAWWDDGIWFTMPLFGVGVICSLIALLFVAVFHLRTESATVPVWNRDAFLRQAGMLLDAMGYEVGLSEGQLVGRPGFQALLLGGSVRITLDSGEARIQGPKLSVERLSRHLRFEDHVGQLHQEREHAFSESLVKRVELTLRPTPHQLAAVQANVLEPLAEHAELRCELCIGASGPDGIRTPLLEQVRGWLDQQGIPATFHRDHTQFDELRQLHERAPQEVSV